MSAGAEYGSARTRWRPQYSESVRYADLPAWRRIVLVGAAVVALFALGLAWSLASAPGGAPDEDFHLASIWCATGDPGMCQRTGREIEDGIESVRVIPALGKSLVCFAHAPKVSAACQAAARERGAPAVSRANDGLYPGGFYKLMSVFATTNVGLSVVVVRMVSWVIAVSLLAAAWLLAPRRQRPSLAVAALTTLVPLGVYLFASANPSGLAVAGIVSYWLAALTFLTRDSSAPRQGSLLAVMLAGSAVALGSRSDAGLFVAIASLAAWLSAAGYRALLWRRSVLVAAIACAGIAASLLGRQSQGWADGLGVEQGQTRVALLFEGILDLPSSVLGSLGTSPLGWLDTPMPPIVGTLMLLAFAGALLMGVSVATRERWLAHAVVAGALVGLPLLVLSSGQEVQPRYLLPLLPILIGTALITRPLDPPVTFRPAYARLIVLAVVLAHAAALHSVIRRYVTGVDVGGPDLDAKAEWWWSRAPGPTAVWALGSIAFALVAACVYRLAVVSDRQTSLEARARTARHAVL